MRWPLRDERTLTITALGIPPPALADAAKNAARWLIVSANQARKKAPRQCASLAPSFGHRHARIPACGHYR